MEDEVSSFSLQSSTDSFVSRSRDVFASLVALEDKHSAYLKATATSRDSDHSGLIKNDPDEDDEFVNRAESKNLDSEGYRSWSHGRSQFNKSGNSFDHRCRSRSPNRDNGPCTEGDDGGPDKDCNFKRPAQPPQRLSTKPIPDFRRHPEKYTRYSLEDVSDQDISETSNQRAAFDFLEKQRFEREKLENKLAGLSEEDPKFDVANAACSQGKITFSKSKLKKEQSTTCEKSASKDGVEMLLSESTSDLPDSDEESKHPEPTSVPADAQPDRGFSDSTSPNAFKSRKNIKRHIRTKGSDADSE